MKSIEVLTFRVPEAIVWRHMRFKSTLKFQSKEVLERVLLVCSLGALSLQQEFSLVIM